MIVRSMVRPSFFLALLAIKALAALGTPLAALAAPQSADPTAAAATSAFERLSADIRYLASDELAGRQPGKPGIDAAEEMIIAEFRRLGLRSGVADGSYRQKFSVGEERSLVAAESGMEIAGPSGPIELTLDVDFRPQSASGAFDVSGPLVFVGYGITAPDLNYEEYRNVDVRDKIVVLIRVEPQSDDPKSVFDGAAVSRYAFVQSKVAAARSAGAAGIIMVNDRVTAGKPEGDALADAALFRDAVRDLPFVHLTRRRFEELLEQSPVLLPSGKKLKNLEEIERAIDATLEPLSQPLTGCTARLRATYTVRATIASNIIGVIEGEGPLAEETIIVGAHHDHLGMGEYGSRSGPGAIHNGADDNATGTASVLELARRFAAREKAPRRRLVFICFSAEEMGLLGAFHYCNNPLWPLENTVTMVNFDMTGWLRNDRLTVFDWDSSADFRPLLERANESSKLNLHLPPGGFAGSDHLPFKQRGVPVMFLHTGLTSTYHTPEDDYESINVGGVEKVVDFSERVIDELLALESKPRAPAPSTRFRLGVVLEEGLEEGLRVQEIESGSAAEKAGFQVGDLIREINGKRPSRRREVNVMVREAAGEELQIRLKRGDEEITVVVPVPASSDGQGN